MLSFLPQNSGLQPGIILFPPPPGAIWQCLGIFPVVTTADATGTQRVERPGKLRNALRHTGRPATENCLAQNVSSGGVGKLCFSEVQNFIELFSKLIGYHILWILFRSSIWK